MKRPGFVARIGKHLWLLAGCAVVAAAAATALDQYRLVMQQREIAAQIPPANRSLLAAPDTERWRPKLFEAGTTAPTFDLVDVRTGEQASLEGHRGRRPVVLLLGSFGCNVFSGQLSGLRRLHEAYRERAAFVFIAIKDAGHPRPEMSLADEPHADLTDHATRLWYLRKGLNVYQVSFPCLLDDDGQAERAYR